MGETTPEFPYHLPKTKRVPGEDPFKACCSEAIIRNNPDGRVRANMDDIASPSIGCKERFGNREQSSSSSDSWSPENKMAKCSIVLLRHGLYKREKVTEKRILNWKVRTPQS